MTESAQAIELRTSRVLAATPEEVFDAYTDPEQQTIWFSILDETPGVVRITSDLRFGGRQVAVWGPDEGTLFHETQTFLAIDRPHRLVTESAGSTPDGTTMTTRVAVTFEAHSEGSTLVSVLQTGFPTPEVRDFFESQAWVGAFDRIEAYLASRDSRS